jgi:hypothetical protein
MKKFNLSMVAVILAVMLASFTTMNRSKTSQTMEWFEYIGAPGGEANPNNYVYKTSQTQSCFQSNSDLCEVQADPINPSDPPADHLPDLSTDIPYFRN